MYRDLDVVYPRYDMSGYCVMPRNGNKLAPYPGELVRMAPRTGREMDAPVRPEGMCVACVSTLNLGDANFMIVLVIFFS